MNQTNKALLTLVLPLSLLTLAAVILRSVLLLLFFVPTAQHFSGNTAATLLIISVLLPLLLFAVLSYLMRRTLPKEAQNSSLLSKIILTAFGILSGVFAGYGLVTSLIAAQSPLESLFAVLSHLVLLLYAVFLLIEAFGFIKTAEHSYIYGTVAALAPCLYAMYLYFESAHFMNNPNILLTQLAYVALALTMLTRTKERAENTRKTPFSLFLSMSAIFLAVTASIPSLLFLLFRGDMLTGNLLSDLFLLLAASSLLLPYIRSEETV